MFKNLSSFNQQLQGADVLVVDDMVDTGATMAALSKRLTDAGARNVYVCASHGLFTSNSMDLIDKSPVKQVIVTNTLPLPAVVSPKIAQVSVDAVGGMGYYTKT